MALIADILLIAGALAASFYCFMLSRRLKRLNQLDSGVGGAISALSEKISEMNDATRRIDSHAKTCAEDLEQKIELAEAAGEALESLLSRAEHMTASPRGHDQEGKHAPVTAHQGNVTSAKFKPRFGPNPSRGERE